MPKRKKESSGRFHQRTPGETINLHGDNRSLTETDSEISDEDEQPTDHRSDPPAATSRGAETRHVSPVSDPPPPLLRGSETAAARQAEENQDTSDTDFDDPDRVPCEQIGSHSPPQNTRGKIKVRNPLII